jgi:hypothetical protein
MKNAPRRIEPLVAIPTVRLRCRIDSPRGLLTAPDGLVLVTGVAAAEPGGPVRVEVRLDGGPWRPAVPEAEPSGGRWLRWQAELRVLPGLHRVHARATDPGGGPAPRPWARPMQGWSVREFVLT